MSQLSSSGKPDRRAVAKAVLSLGSNVGERESHVLTAASRLASSGGVFSARLSSLYETVPVGDGYSRSFINAVMVLETTLVPRSLLALGQGLEREAGRVVGGVSGDRTLDVDLILFGESRIVERDLILPHPRFMKRLFVLVPLAELEPGFVLPGGGTAAQAAESDEAEGGVERISSRSMIRRKSL